MTELSIDNDKELIAGCLKNDATCQKRLYNLYAPKMYTVCLRYAHNQDEAKDFLQDGFIRVFRALESFRFSGSFEGWMRRIFVNTALEELRKKGRLSTYDNIENKEIADHGNRALNSLQMTDILKEIQKLPDGYRTVFNLYVLDGYQHNEIAKMLGISESTSKTQLRKARLSLQNRLTELKTN
jgi:RNA polymerase sigma-70 factor (ECF subfamily)